jgi:YD repeat-containing protein
MHRKQIVAAGIHLGLLGGTKMPVGTGLRAASRTAIKSRALVILLFGAMSAFGAAQEARADFPPVQQNNYTVVNNLFPWGGTAPGPVCSHKVGSTCHSAEGTFMCTEENTNCGNQCGGEAQVGIRPIVDNGQHKCEAFRGDTGASLAKAVYDVSAAPSACPANSTLVAGSCRCNANYTESDSSCIPRSKIFGKPDPLLCVGNPCNVGTGTKFQTEAVFRSGGSAQLVERLSYNSRLLSDTGLVSNGAYGKGWKGNYDRQVTVHNAVVIISREDGRELDFRPPASGNMYVPDADVSDRLERLVDGSGNTTGWKYVVAADDSAELYGPTGKLLSISDLAGSTVTLAYSDASTPPSVAPAPGLLIAVADAWGRTLAFVYNGQSRVVRMTDPGNGNYDVAYDAPGNLSSITFPDTKVRQYKYNEPEHTQNTALPHSLTGIIDENGARFSTYKYDPQGRVVSTEHAGGAQKSTLEYTSPSVTTVTDARNVARSYGLTTLLEMVKGTGVTGSACPACGPAEQTYDANGNVASRTDWNGNRTNYSHDLARNLETSRTEGLTSAGATTPQTRTISTQWHATFRLPTGIAEPLRITTNVYDADGTQCGARGALCSRSVQATTDPDGSQAFSATATGSPRTWAYTYNANGSVLTVNGPRTDVADITTYTYYANDDAHIAKRGNVATIANAAGHTTSITAYNAHGQPLTIVDANSLTTTLTYDERQRLKTRTVGSELTSYDYDFAGQLKKVTLPDGSFLSYTYDDAHRLTAIQDNLGNRIDYTVDAMGNRTLEQVRDPENALAQTRSREYSTLNRLFRELGATSQTTEHTYDDQGNVLTVKDPLNRVTTNQYDALNRLKQVTSPTPISAVTQYAYNGLDALTKVTDPRSLETGYAVDGLGNLNVQTSPDTGTTTNTYGSAGNLITQTDAKSQVTTYAYDALNRVTLITFHDGAKQTYVYDQPPNGIGRLSSITERNPADQVTSVLAYAYDQHGRVLSETRTVNGVQYVLGYRYDAFGRLDQLTYPSARTVNYTFDALGRVSGMTTTKPGDQPQTVVSGVTYHPFGGVKSYTLGNTQVYMRGIDLDGRITSYTLGSESFAIGYDLASRIEFISRFQPATPPNINTYGYDNLDRLTSATLPTTPYTYAYDSVGNRTSKTSGSSTDTYAYSPTSNRIASITPSSGPVKSFVFDPNGSTTADGQNTYVYDVRGRMVQATSSIGATSYQVNALGQRIRKTNTLGDTVFHYDTQGKLIAETGPGGALKRELIYLGDIPVGVVQ